LGQIEADQIIFLKLMEVKMYPFYLIHYACIVLALHELAVNFFALNKCQKVVQLFIFIILL